MNDYQKIFSTTLLAIVLFSSLSISSISAESHPVQTEIIPLDGTIGLEKTILTLNVPENNQLPWAFVEGKISNPVTEYPVIIQIFDNNNSAINGNNVGAVHFAQTKINSDGSYEHKFRVADITEGKIVNIFEGDYTVKIFKVVYINSGLNAL